MLQVHWTLCCLALLTVLFLNVEVRMSMHKAAAAWYVPLSSPLQFVPFTLPLALEYSDVKDPYWEKAANFSISAHRCIIWHSAAWHNLQERQAHVVALW